MLTREHHPAGPGPSTPLVRPAGPADHAAIRDILRAAYSQYTADIPPQVWDTDLADLLDLDRHARDGDLLVAVVDGAIAGYAAFHPGLAVHPAYRGRGVAAALLAELEYRSRDAGADVFAFHTSAFMTTAVALYERLGYRRAPEFDLDVNAHYGIDAATPWPALAYLRRLSARRGARAA